LTNGRKKYIYANILICVLIACILIKIVSLFIHSSGDQAGNLLFSAVCLMVSIFYMIKDTYCEVNGYPRYSEI